VKLPAAIVIGRVCDLYRGVEREREREKEDMGIGLYTRQCKSSSGCSDWKASRRIFPELSGRRNALVRTEWGPTCIIPHLRYSSFGNLGLPQLISINLLRPSSSMYDIQRPSTCPKAKLHLNLRLRKFLQNGSSCRGRKRMNSMQGYRKNGA
jgi:hypothetical protein